MALLDPITITITRSDNETKSFSGRPSNSEPFGITELIGFEFPEVEVFTQPRGLGDGVFFTGQRLNGRTIEIHLKQNERYPQDFFDGWNALKSFFNPALTFTISVDNETSGVTVTRQLNDCRILAADYHMINASEPNPELIVQMMAPDPYLIDSTSSEARANALASGTHLTLTNGGDVGARFKLTMTCTNAGSNPQSINLFFGASTVPLQVYNYNSGQGYQVGDVIINDFENGICTVNGNAAVAGGISTAYNTWILDVGTEDFYFNDAAGSKWNVVIEWSQRYMGI